MSSKIEVLCFVLFLQVRSPVWPCLTKMTN